MRIKRIISGTLIFCMLFVFCACDKQNEYYSNDVDLHAIAINSLLGAYTYESDKVQVIETDSFGRKLFLFESNTHNDSDKSGRILAVLISQKTNGNKAYFYDNVNCLYCPSPKAYTFEEFDNDTEKIVTDSFSDEQIASLKKANDWDKPLDADKFFEIKVDSFKRDTVSNSKREKAFLLIGSEGKYNDCIMEALTRDKNGKSLYFVRTGHSTSEDDKNYIMINYVIMFDKNGNVDSSKGIMEIKDVWNYGEQLASFKSANDWNK